MLCPKDLVQMNQYQGMGGGESTDEHYETWELKQCPVCGRIYKEFYSATLLEESDVAKGGSYAGHNTVG